MAKELKKNSNVSERTKKELDKQAKLVEKQSKEREAKIKKEKAAAVGKTVVGAVKFTASPGVIGKTIGAANMINGASKSKNAEKNVDKKNEKALKKQEKKLEKSLEKDLRFKSKDEKEAIVNDFDVKAEAAKDDHHLDDNLDVTNAKASDVKEQSKTIKENIKEDKSAEKAAKHDERVKQAEQRLNIEDIQRNQQLQQSGMEY